VVVEAICVPPVVDQESTRVVLLYVEHAHHHGQVLLLQTDRVDKEDCISYSLDYRQFRTKLITELKCRIPPTQKQKRMITKPYWQLESYGTGKKQESWRNDRHRKKTSYQNTDIRIKRFFLK
jgi:hypothetical protein